MQLSGKQSPGQPAYHDAEALREIRQIMWKHPKWSITKAAMHYAAAHPEEKASTASIARRLGDKLRRQMGKPPQPRALRKRLLNDLIKTLVRALWILEELSKLEDQK